MIWSGIIVMAATLLLYALFWQILLQRVAEDKTFNVKRPMLFYATWIAFVCALGQSQILTDFSSLPPRFLLFWVVILITAAAFAFSETGKTLAAKTPLWILIGFQGFRILAEWTLYNGYKEGMFPVQMTFEGRNFDIVTGILALLLIPILRKNPDNRALAWSFNIIGFVLLVTITVIATVSAPTPLRQFMNEPANTAVAFMPHILLPGVLVQAAYAGHFLLTRKLLCDSKRSILRRSLSNVWDINSSKKSQ